MEESFFSPELFHFLRELRENNDREWFRSNRNRYEEALRQPFLRFIACSTAFLTQISPHLVGDPRPTGGSLFRIHRDTRFSKDKSPYKTHAGAHFWHGGLKKNAHTPGFYLHLEPDTCFAASGLWHPDSSTTRRVRAAIDGRPQIWIELRQEIRLEGDKLSRPPLGYAADHPLVEDLKHKDFVTSVPLTEEQVCARDFLPCFSQACRQMSPLVEFLSRALELQWKGQAAVPRSRGSSLPSDRKLL